MTDRSLALLSCVDSQCSLAVSGPGKHLSQVVATCRACIKSSAVLAAIFLSLSAAFPFLSAYAEPICTVVGDAATGETVLHEGICDQRFTPASTFKIALSLMGYDSGYLINEHLPTLPFHDGYPAWIASWRATTDPTSWMNNSVVWYSQRITEWLGMERFKEYVAKFHYGNEDVSGNPGKNDGLTQAWLTSSLKISPLEQLAFLQRIVRRQLSVSAHAYEMTSRITAVAVLANGWEVHGKTGTGFRMHTDGSVDSTRQVGWFVGWATKGDRAMVFAHCIREEAGQSVRTGLRAREAFMARLPRLIDSP